MALNMQKVEELVGKSLNDMAALLGGNLIVIGDKLGLFKAMARLGPTSSIELARETGTAERYVREWLSALAAGGYVTYDAETEKYHLSEEQRECLTNEESPFCVLGGFRE